MDPFAGFHLESSSRDGKNGIHAHSQLAAHVMRFYQKFIFPFLPNPFCYLRIQDGRVEHVRWGTVQFDLPLDGPVVHFEPPGFLGSIGGWGSVTLNYEGSPYEVPSLVSGITVRDSIERAKGTVKTVGGRPPGIPDGVSLGTKLVLMPYLSGVFNGPIWYQHCSSAEHPNWKVKVGDWVRRGDELISLLVHRPRVLGSDKHAWVTSPVSGLVVFTADDRGTGVVFEDDTTVSRSWIAILLPEFEPTPLSAKEIFSRLWRPCFEHRASIYQGRDNHGWDDNSDEGLKNEFMKQLDEEPIVIDLLDVQSDEDEGYYYNYINLLREERPDLVPHLRHIGRSPLAQQSSEARTSCEPEDFVTLNSAHQADLSDVQRAAIVRFEIEQPFSQQQLDAKYEHWCEQLPYSMRAQLQRDYETLKPLAS